MASLLGDATKPQRLAHLPEPQHPRQPLPVRNEVRHTRTSNNLRYAMVAFVSAGTLTSEIHYGRSRELG